MGKAVTSPPEWRRRAATAGYDPSEPFPPAPTAAPDAAGRWTGPTGGQELGATALGGWAALEAGDDAAAGPAGAFCRRFAWEQPDDVAGVLLGWDDDADRPAEPLLRPHAAGQPYGDVGAAIGFLARSFEEGGDDDDLEAAVELHDLVVAMGDGVWQAPNVLVGVGAAVLYRVTGEDAFLATTERVADAVAEVQGPDGSWAGDGVLTAFAAASLMAMADAVESREGVDEGE